MIKAPWILMIETDYVWHKPVQAPRADSDALPIAFPFGYIQPTAPCTAHTPSHTNYKQRTKYHHNALSTVSRVDNEDPQSSGSG